MLIILTGLGSLKEKKNIMPRYLIIDGYNAISKIKEFDAKKDVSLEASRLYFIKTLMDFADRKAIFNKIIVVFDGKGEDMGITRHSYGKVEALFTMNDKDADSAIVDILRISTSQDKITVCSDDNFVRNHARAFSADVMPIKELEDIIILKKDNRRGKIKEKDIGTDKLNKITQELRKYWAVE